MTKTEMVRCTAEAAGEQLKTTEAVVNAFLNQVTMALAAGEKVQLIGFGSFEVRDRKSRIGKNPRTGEKIEIPAYRVPTFKAGAALKDAVK